METLKDYRFTRTHEWVRTEADTAFVGLSNHAQELLGDIVFVELPELGIEVKMEEETAVIESVKAASPIYAPVSGKIVKINNDLDKNQELINKKPYDTFIFAIEMDNPSEIDSLLTESEYLNFLKTES